MNKDFLMSQLNNIENAKRVNRLRVANLVLENHELFPSLLEIVFEGNAKTSIRAAWVLELVCANKIEWLVPFLEFFTKNIPTLKHDSSVRPISKICMFLAQIHSKKTNLLGKTLTKKHIERIIETGFDWMITNQKVAAKAYTMTTLYLLGKNVDWVHQELKLIIQQNITTESAAYKARGSMTLALINKK